MYLGVRCRCLVVGGWAARWACLLEGKGNITLLLKPITRSPRERVLGRAHEERGRQLEPLEPLPGHGRRVGGGEEREPEAVEASALAEGTR